MSENVSTSSEMRWNGLSVPDRVHQLGTGPLANCNAPTLSSTGDTAKQERFPDSLRRWNRLDICIVMCVNTSIMSD